MRIRLTLKNVQHIREMVFDVDLDRHALICITGKNGAGKTTLVKAIRNLTNADTFSSTSSGDIFGPLSSITYQVDGSTIFFGYDPKLGSLNSSDDILKRPGFRVGQLVYVRRSRSDQRVVGGSLPRTRLAGHCPWPHQSRVDDLGLVRRSLTT